MYGACVLATGFMEEYRGVWLVLPKAAVMCNLLLVHVWGVLGVCALGCMKVYMLWCRYMCFLFVCQGNSEGVASLAVYGGCHGDKHVQILLFGCLIKIMYTTVHQFCHLSSVNVLNPDISMTKP